MPPLSVNKDQTLTPAGPFFYRTGNVEESLHICHWMWDSPLGDEVYKLWGETVGRQLWRRLVHHLLELLERGAPWLVGEFQNGQLDLGHRERLMFELTSMTACYDTICKLFPQFRNPFLFSKKGLQWAWILYYWTFHAKLYLNFWGIQSFHSFL